MRIAFVTYSFPSLTQTFILNQIIGLIEMGHDIEIFAPTSEEGKVHPNVKAYNLLEKTTYINSSKKNLETILDLPKFLFRSGNISNLAKQIFLLTRSIKERNNLVYAVHPFLNKKKFDVIHCHFGWTGNLFAKIIDYIPHGLFITSFYGYDVSIFSETELSNDLLCKKGDAFLPLSHDMKNKLLSLGFPEKKIITETN
jgi:colanic acid/amylovoran biosynthesis glycosyltransferase